MRNLPPSTSAELTPVADMVTPALVREYARHRVQASSPAGHLRTPAEQARLAAVVDELVRREVLD